MQVKPRGVVEGRKRERVMIGRRRRGSDFIFFSFWRILMGLVVRERVAVWGFYLWWC